MYNGRICFNDKAGKMHSVLIPTNTSAILGLFSVLKFRKKKILNVILYISATNVYNRQINHKKQF